MAACLDPVIKCMYVVLYIICVVDDVHVRSQYVVRIVGIDIHHYCVQDRLVVCLGQHAFNNAAVLFIVALAKYCLIN